MSPLRRLFAWAGWSSRSDRVLETGRRPELQLGEIVRHRFNQLESSMDWPGKSVVIAIGTHERELRTAAETLKRADSASPSLVRRASELRRDLLAMLAPDGRLAELVAVWPARWNTLAHRFIALEQELRARRTAVDQLLKTATEARMCSARLQQLNAQFATTQPVTWKQLIQGLNLEHGVTRIETSYGAQSVMNRLEMAEAVLQETESLALRGLLQLRDSMNDRAGSATTGASDESLEEELERRRADTPVQCKAAVKDAGLRISNASMDHLQRLTKVSDATIRSRAQRLFGEVPAGPLLYWARLHYSKVKPPTPTRKRA